jgi:hypothetical protein
MKIEFSRQIFEKFSNTKFHENPLGGRRIIKKKRTGSQTARLDEPKIQSSKFFERA